VLGLLSLLAACALAIAMIRSITAAQGRWLESPQAWFDRTPGFTTDVLFQPTPQADVPDRLGPWPSPP
jgi:hypothetical protein